MKNNSLQLFLTVGELRIFVDIKKECCIGQPGSHDPFVPRGHLIPIPALDVTDRYEPGFQCAAVVGDREITLVRLEARNEHLARQIEDALVEFAGVRDRPFA